VSLDWLTLQCIVDAAPEGVVVCSVKGLGTQRSWPVSYANRAFEQMTGYSSDELIGRTLSFLQQGEDNQDGLVTMRAALRQGIACRAVLKNYRKNGEAFMNELQLLPLRDTQGNLAHYVSFHRLGSEEISATIGESEVDTNLSTQRLLAHVREDRQTGLLRRSYFEDVLRRDFSLAQREQKPITFLMFEIDQAAAYRDVFGPMGSEQTFKRVARTIAGCFKRQTDLCARWEETQIVATMMSVDSEQGRRFAEYVAARVRELGIHHPRATGTRFVTVSYGVVTDVPGRHDNVSQFITRATRDLHRIADNSAMRQAM
jgi:diguanylate cyclase (GGDEF)-like protein/PAS domain S-box-containing protein